MSAVENLRSPVRRHSEIEPSSRKRHTIFGRATITRNDLLRQLAVDGQDKVGVEDIQNYVNSSMKQSQQLGWYKFAALFGFIVIILQACTTFGVVLWGDSVSRQLYAKPNEGMATNVTGSSLTNADGEAIDATGFLPGTLNPADMYSRLDNGEIFSFLSGTLVSTADDNEFRFNFNIAGSSKTGDCCSKIGDAWKLYTMTGATILVSEDKLSLTVDGQEYDDWKLVSGTRRRMQSSELSFNVGIKASSGIPTCECADEVCVPDCMTRCGGVDDGCGGTCNEDCPAPVCGEWNDATNCVWTGAEPWNLDLPDAFDQEECLSICAAEREEGCCWFGVDGGDNVDDEGMSATGKCRFVPGYGLGDVGNSDNSAALCLASRGPHSALAGGLQLADVIYYIGVDPQTSSDDTSTIAYGHRGTVSGPGNPGSADNDQRVLVKFDDTLEDWGGFWNMFVNTISTDQPQCIPDCTGAGKCGGASNGCGGTCDNACSGGAHVNYI